MYQFISDLPYEKSTVIFEFISTEIKQNNYVDNFSVLVRSPTKYSSLFTYYYSLLHVQPHMGYLQGET